MLISSRYMSFLTMNILTVPCKLIKKPETNNVNTKQHFNFHS